MAIHLLDQHTAELIAAGEVVERPSSVVKELCENAIDAGATTVSVDIEGGGIALIRVSDDGRGIEAADLPLAFVRHATSKVRTADDLEAIGTLGFRGEALASIASVAKVRLLTKHDADTDASEYNLAGGAQGEAATAARPRGTTVEVRELFYNTPARMKFLKKDASEGTFVTETVSRLALSHPEVAFRYQRDGKAVFATPGDGVLKSAVWEVLGAAFARELLPVDELDGHSRVHGLVTPPRAGRASRGMQYFFVGGRFVKNRTMMAALEQAYRGMAMHGKFPGAVLFLEMPPALVDVNVHPAKTEVRFANEQDVFHTIYRAVKATLLANAGGHNRLDLSAGEGAAPSPPQEVTRPAAAAPPMPAKPAAAQVAAANQMVRQAAGEGLASDGSFIVYQTSRQAPAAPPPVDGTAAMADRQARENHPGLDVFADEDEAGIVKQESFTEETEDPASLRLVGELFKTYIVAEAGDTLCLIDKHAAHERLLYEKIAAARGGAASQQLLAPVTVQLSAAEKDALLQNGESLEAAGIEVEDFGGGAVLVRGVPADVEQPDIEGLVTEVAGRLAVNAKDTLNAKTEWVLHSIACRAAVKAGDSTPRESLLALAQDILSGAVPPFCPHGRPVVLKITRKELEKQFGRLG